MTNERGEVSVGNGAKAAKANGIFGSLRDALMAAARDDTATNPPPVAKPSIKSIATIVPPIPAAPAPVVAASPSAEDAARAARQAAVTKAVEKPVERVAQALPDNDAPPTTRVVRAPPKAIPEKELPEKAPRTQLVRGRQAIQRQSFEQDPVVGFLIIVGGPGLGSFRPVFEGNNTVGRSADNRVPLDFGDDTISSEAQAYIRYDSNDRSFLFVPNLAKTNVVSVNDKRPTGALELKAMDVITFGRTQVAFVPFCGAEFDWSEISET